MVWISSSLSMRQRSSVTADECLPPAENRCEAKKANMTKSRSASSADGIAARRTLATVCGESTEVKRLSICCDRREASDPPRVAASTVP